MAKNTIYVTGHKNPDTDSIISAMAYAYYKQQTGHNAVAVRIGELNQETEYILKLFNEFAPPLAKDIRTRIRDIDFDSVVTCSPKTNFRDALKLMREKKKKVVAVVDDNKHLMGMATVSDITGPLVEDSNRKEQLVSETDIEDICVFLNAELNYLGERSNNGKVHILVSSEDTDCKDEIVITNADSNRHKIAINSGASCIIAVNGYEFSDGIVELAKKHQCSLISCEGDIFNIACDIYFATHVEKVMSKNLKTFGYDDYVDDVKQAINQSRFRCYPILDRRKHIIGTLSRYHVFQHTSRSLILVDHNEFSQSIDGAEDAHIIEIIDHHRIGGIKTSSPVYFRNEMLGCCASIITKIFLENNVEIPEDLAGLLCCAIISDTVNFKSVTCTNQDIELAEMLAKKANLDLEELGPRILAVGAKLSNKSVFEIFHNDLKQFTINRLKITVAQANAVNLEAVLPIKNEMKQLMDDYARDSGSSIAIMAFTLIDGSGSYVLTSGKEVKRIEPGLKKNGEEVDGFVFLKGFISRKQQIIPMLTETIEGN